MPADAPRAKLPLAYFALVFLLILPFWIFGGSRLPLPMNLPAAALGTFVPALAAAILTYRSAGMAGVRRLLARAVDFRGGRKASWYALALLLPPLLFLLTYAGMRLVGRPLPDPIHIPLLAAPAYFVMFFIADAGEELGWSGYAIDPLLERWGTLKAGLVLGVIWALWHAIPYVQTHNPPDWVIWQTLSVIPVRVLIVRVYQGSGKSVLAAIIFHVMNNIGWSLFPNNGSHYDPFVYTLITLAVTAAVALWGTKAPAQGGVTPAGDPPAPD